MAFVRKSLVFHLAALTLLLPVVALAADPAFVGVLALAVEDEVAADLKIDEATRSKLLDIVDEREDEALELVLSIRDLPENERKAKLAEFAGASEAAGFKLLSDEQQTGLRQIRIARDGMSTLGEAAIRQKLNLTEQQQTKIDALMKQRAEALTSGGEAARRATSALYERRLAGVLTDDQRLAWEQLAGVADEGVALNDPPVDSTAEPEDQGAGDTAPADPPADGGDDKPETTDEPADDSPADDAVNLAAANDGEVKLKFNFAYTPWETVLEWFAEQADLSLEATTIPEGTFNYTDSRAYSPTEAIDLLNSVLLTKGYTLLRHRRMLMVINLEDGVPPNLVETVPLEDLDDRGKYELISTLFKVEHITAEDAEEEVSKLLGPQGSIVVMPKSGALLITETGGRLRVIRDLLQAAEKPAAESVEELEEVVLEHAVAEEVLAVVRQLLGLPEDRNAAPDGSLKIATDSLGSKLFLSGEPEKVKQVKDILKLVDVPSGFEDGLPKVIETPQLEVYAVPVASPESVLAVMQTLLAGQPDVRLAIDEKTGHLVAMARPSQHATIRATLDQMQKDGRQIEVINLRYVDPQLAVLSINKLFSEGGEEGVVDSRAPKVDADPTTGQLLIRATQDQIDQIKTLLEKMGETEFGDGGPYAETDRGNVRMIPLTGRAARDAIDQLQLVWPTMHRNKIRLVTPSASSAIRTKRTGGEPIEGEPPRGAGGIPDLRGLEGLFNGDFPMFRIEPRGSVPKSDAPKSEEREEKREETPEGNEPPAEPAKEDSQARRDAQPLFRFAAYQPAEDEEDAPPAEGEPKPIERQGPPAEIIISITPQGIILASEDKEALDAMELLLETLSARASGGDEYTVFYLKYARAEVAAEILTEVLGGGSGGGSGGGGGSLLGSLAGAALGDAGGGLLGSLLGGGGGGGITTSGSVAMVADRRLNALIVEANPEDLDTVEQLLTVIDQEASPEDVQTFARPRLIPVFHTDAAEIAGVVRDVYSSRLEGSRSSQRQPSPEEFIRALRGGGRGRGGGGSAQQEEQKMTIGVDERSNSLVVSASEPLFQEVKALVEQLDQAGAEETETMRVINIRGANPELVQQALVAITGGKVTAGTTSSPGQGGTTSNNSSNRGGSDADRQRRESEQARDEFRRRIEFFNALQRSGQFGGDRGQGGRLGGGATQGGRPGSGGGRPGGGR